METTLVVARKAADHLAANGIENARLDAELLLAAVLGNNAAGLYLQHDRPLTEGRVQAYRLSIRRRLKREPVQYILGDAAFRELTLKVDKRVLIPRAGDGGARRCRARLDAKPPGASDAVTRRRGDAVTTAIDLGTGSGAIASEPVGRGAVRACRCNGRFG